jgi:AraC-like DNA-binding protein
MLEVIRTLPFEPFFIDHLVDARGRYPLDLDPQFPLAVKLYDFSRTTGPYPMNWHERLEIFVPLSGTGRFRMGDRIIDFAQNDILVVDNLKLHGLHERPVGDGRAMTVTFNPDLVYNIASPPSDFAYLIPFRCQSEAVSPVIRNGEPIARRIHEPLAKLLECYFDPTGGTHTRLGCKAYLLEVLFHLSCHFDGAAVAHSEYVRQEERARRLGRLFDYLQQHYASPVTVTQAARIVGMSGSRFMKFFKQATGTTFVGYVTHIRLAHACELLRETDLAVSEIAARVGFADHAYLDRRFKQYFRASPRGMRAEWSARSRPSSPPAVYEDGTCGT